MIVSITKAGLKGLVWRPVFHAVVVALLVISSPQANALAITSLSDSADIQTQAAIIDLSGRKDADAFSNINQLLNAGNYKTAIKNAQTVLKKRPNSGLANEILGTAYFLDGQYQESMAPLARAAKLEPDQSGALTKLGIILMEGGKLAEAENLLLQAVKINPENRFAHQRLGMLYEYQEKDQLAMRHFIRGLQGTRSDYIGIAVNLGHLLNKAGNYPATVALLEPRVSPYESLSNAQLVLATAYLATGEYSKARIRFQRVLEQDPPLPEALRGLARAQRGEDDLQEARSTIRKLIVLEPKSASARVEEGNILLRLDLKKNASAAFDKAESLGVSRSFINRQIAKYHLDRKEFPQARDVYQAMVNDGTADALDYGQLSELLMRQGNIDKGKQVLRKGVMLFPDNAYMNFRYASYLASIRQYQESLPGFKKATELAPGDATIWKAYAIALGRAGHKNDAVKAAAKLYELRPNQLEAAIFYATQLEADNQLQEAEVLYNKIIKAEPDNALALNNQANVLASQKKYSEAEKMARRATSIASDNGYLQDTLGWILYRQGRMNEAQEVLSHASELAPEAAVIWYHKGVVLAENGRQAEARTAFEKALSLDPTADWVANAKAKLQ